MYAVNNRHLDDFIEKTISVDGSIPYYQTTFDIKTSLLNLRGPSRQNGSKCRIPKMEGMHVL